MTWNQNFIFFGSAIIFITFTTAISPPLRIISLNYNEDIATEIIPRYSPHLPLELAQNDQNEIKNQIPSSASAPTPTTPTTPTISQTSTITAKIPITTTSSTIIPIIPPKTTETPQLPSKRTLFDNNFFFSPQSQHLQPPKSQQHDELFASQSHRPPPRPDLSEIDDQDLGDFFAFCVLGELIALFTLIMIGIGLKSCCQSSFCCFCSFFQGKSGEKQNLSSNSMGREGYGGMIGVELGKGDDGQMMDVEIGKHQKRIRIEV